MANEFKHKNVGVGLESTEWEAVDLHIADGQTLNDMAYFDGTHWVRAPRSLIRTLLNVADGADVTGSNAPQAHKDTHDPEDGVDPLDTAAPVQIGAANAEGTSHSLARADHVHQREHARYTDAEAKTQAEGAKLDDHAPPDDNTDLDASGALHGLMGKADKSKLDGVEALADVTDAVTVGASIHGVAAKATPVDADTMPLIDSAAANALKKVTWANIKAFLKTYFDTLYRGVTANHTHASSGAQAGQLTNPLVNEAVALTATATHLNLTDDLNFLDILARRKKSMLGTGVDGGNTSDTNSGGGWGILNGWLGYTGTDANSVHIRYYNAQALYLNGYDQINWDKDWTFTFDISRGGSDAQCVAYVQFKTVNTEGDLGADGLGIKVANLAAYSESYGGAARDSTTLNTNITEWGSIEIRIEHTAGSNDKFYVDGTLQHTESTDVPTGTAVSYTHLTLPTSDLV